uniref:Uncharacterized protein n=1 Tax=Cryptomonas curvata TaxID=233186 RepID=A0A7S0N2F6_9CRYP|mmetsp:Transcript_60196/g.125932  ORF Transcript_60196/g.125932 Transcript_60196/m.125932 type:complete len:222 (+) Transcript_60196:69-734(+)
MSRRQPDDPPIQGQCVPASFNLTEQVISAKRPGMATQDIIFPSPIRLGRIAFRNHYVHKLSIYATSKKDAIARKDTMDGWTVLVKDRQLMAQAQCEDDAQMWHGVAESDLACAEDGVVAVRLVLVQASDMWKTFAVRHVTVDSVVTAPPHDPPSPSAEQGSPLAEQLAKSRTLTAHVDALAAACSDLRRHVSVITAGGVGLRDSDTGPGPVPVHAGAVRGA